MASATMSTIRVYHAVRPRYSVTVISPSLAYSPAPNRLGAPATPVSRFSAPGTPRCEEVVYRTSLRSISSRRPSSRSGCVRWAVRIKYGYRSAPELCGVYSRVVFPAARPLPGR